MARRNFREVHIRRQACFLYLGELVRRQNVVQILGNNVGIQFPAQAAGGRRGETPAARDLLDAGNQFLGSVALRHLLPDQPRLGRFERVIQISQQGPQGQTHRSSSSVFAGLGHPHLLVESQPVFRARSLAGPPSQANALAHRLGRAPQ